MKLVDPANRDELSARKRIAAEEQEAERRERKDSARARSELEEDRSRLEAEMRAAARLMGRIVAIERKAQEKLNRRCSGPDALTAIARILSTPGIRTIRGLNGQEPLQRTSRPKGRDGAVSFHFSVEALTKGGELADILAQRISIKTALSSSWSHQRYIEREDAKERLSAVNSQSYIDNPDKTEQARRSQQDIVTAASFGTIGDTSEERERFWRAVDEAEEAPRTPEVTLNPAIGPEVWEKIREIAARRRNLPPILIEALSARAPVVGTVSTRDGAILIDIFRKAGFPRIRDRPSKGGPPEPIQFKLGKGGRVQTRIIVELPHEMTARQRLDLAEAFCSPYRADRLPFWAVIHRPTQHNDDRNFHLHVNLYDRPAARMKHPQTGDPIWDFEYVENFEDKYRHRRSRRPAMQNKLRAMSKLDWIKTERRRFAQLANGHLEAAGHAKRLDARTYVEMGVQQEARARISKGAYARERKGQETPEGAILARQEWHANLNAITLAVGSYASCGAEISAKVRRAVLAQEGRQTVDAKAACKIAKQIMECSAERADSLIEYEAYSFVAAKLESRARLKAPALRDAFDEVALAVAEEIKRKAGTARLFAERFSSLIDRDERQLQALKRIDDAAIAAERQAAVKRELTDILTHLGNRSVIGVAEHGENADAAPPVSAKPVAAAPEVRQHIAASIPVQALSVGEVVAGYENPPQARSSPVFSVGQKVPTQPAATNSLAATSTTNRPVPTRPAMENWPIQPPGADRGVNRPPAQDRTDATQAAGDQEARDRQATIQRGREEHLKAMAMPHASVSATVSRAVEQHRHPERPQPSAARQGPSLEEMKVESVAALNSFLVAHGSIRGSYGQGSVEIPVSTADLQPGQPIGDLVRLSMYKYEFEKFIYEVQRQTSHDYPTMGATVVPERLADLIRQSPNEQALERLDRAIFKGLTQTVKVRTGRDVPIPSWPHVMKKRASVTQPGRAPQRNRGMER